MKKITLKTLVVLLLLLTTNYTLLGQCANTSNIYSFEYDGRTYEIVRENKTWEVKGSYQSLRVGEKFRKIISPFSIL